MHDEVAPFYFTECTGIPGDKADKQGQSKELNLKHVY